MYKLAVNEKYNFDLNQDTLDWDITALDNGKFHVLSENKSYEATVLEVDYAEKTFLIKINGNTYTVALKDRFDQLIADLGFEQAMSKKVNVVKAPMPGLVLDILVKVGDQISKGDSVLILEAMKMENVLKAEGDGIVKAINIEKGIAVEKNQLLIDFE